MKEMGNGSGGDFDEFLMLVLGVIGLALTALFLAMPALRVYYALVMPAVIAGGALLSWGLLYVARTVRARGEAPSPGPVAEER